MSLDYKIISIGSMACNIIWGEKSRVRTQHATITLVETDERRFLIDPSLPTEILEIKLHERTGKGLDQITDVFCTTLHPTARRGIEGLVDANWWCSELELTNVLSQANELSESSDEHDYETADCIEKELSLLRKFRPAPDKFTDNIGIYPLPGYSDGCTGLLLTPPANTILITGPAVPTLEHLYKGMIWEDCIDRDTAKQSLLDIIDVADIVIPGFDNIGIQSSRWTNQQFGF